MIAAQKGGWPMLLALWEKSYTAWSIADWAVFIVVVAAVVGIVAVVLRVFGVTIPEWVVKILWIVLGAVIAVLAIRLVASL